MEGSGGLAVGDEQNDEGRKDEEGEVELELEVDLVVLNVGEA